MKKILLIPVICLTALVTFLPITSFGQAGGLPDFKAFLPKWEQAINRFVNGDPGPWKEICLQTDDATILGGFGGYEKGWKEVGPRYDWAAAQFKESGAKVKFEYISTVASEDLAYIVVIERGELRIGNIEKPVPQVLRATQIFRKVAGNWKLIHRHADALIEKKAPSTARK